MSKFIFTCTHRERAKEREGGREGGMMNKSCLEPEEYHHLEPHSQSSMHQCQYCENHYSNLGREMVLLEGASDRT